MKHIILTRYNWGLYSKKIIQKDKPLNYEFWMNHRFQLFSQLCASSILNQTNKDFTWFLFFDEKTPKDYIAEVDQLLCNTHHTLYIYRHTLEISFVGLAKKAMKEYGVIGSDDEIITTRLDNDDIVHESFIEKIQNHYHNNLTHKTPFSIDFPVGLRYVVNLGILEKQAQPSPTYGSNCVSLVEHGLNIENFKTVMCHPHNTLSLEIDGIKDTSQPMWIMCVHGQNSSRTNNPQVRYKINEVPNGFFCNNQPIVISL